MSARKKSFILYNDYRKHIERLDDREAGQLFKAIFSYVSGEEPPALSPMADMAMSFISEQLERDHEKWEETCRKRKEAVESRWEKRNNDTSVYKCIQKDTNVYNSVQSDTNDTDTVNETETVNDNVNVIENDNETVNENKNDSVIETEDETVHDKTPLTEKQMEELVGLSSLSSVENYLNKLSLWQERTGKRCHDPYSTIKKWIEEDGRKKVSADSQSSYDLDEYESFALGKNGFL